MLHVCQPGFEAFLAKELASPQARGPGWVRGGDGEAAEPCFEHYALLEPVEVRGKTGRELAQALVDHFLRTSREERYDAPWPLLVEGSGAEGAGKRANAARELFLELGRKRVSRVIRLAEPGRPGPGRRRGLYAYLDSLERAWVSREARFGGPRRMADDPQAPSRSYLKAEEAYAVLGAAPREGQTVLDLGAAPGGWSYSAAKRGARVLAIDNGPLKGGALNHPLIAHRAEDAFKTARGRVDWLFCDMVEDPDRVLELVGRWIGPGLCGSFVVNLKFGRLDPLPLLRRARAAAAGCPGLRIKHLWHDRDEVTMVGRPGAAQAGLL